MADAPESFARHAALGIKLNTTNESALLAEIAALAAQMRELRIDSRGNAPAIKANLDAAREAWNALRSLRAGSLEPVTPGRDSLARRARRAPAPDGNAAAAGPARAPLGEARPSHPGDRGFHHGEAQAVSR